MADSVYHQRTTNVPKNHVSSPPTYIEATDPDALPTYDNAVPPTSNSNDASYTCQHNWEVPFENENIQFKDLSFCRKLWFLIYLGIFFGFLLLPVAMLLIGIVYQNECPKYELIPTYLRSAGLLAVIFEILGAIYLNSKKRQHCTEEEQRTVLKNVLLIYNAGLIILYFAGIFLIYNSYERDPSKPKKFCVKEVYLFAFIANIQVLAILSAVPLYVVNKYFIKRIYERRLMMLNAV